MIDLIQRGCFFMPCLLPWPVVALSLASILSENSDKDLAPKGRFAGLAMAISGRSRTAGKTVGCKQTLEKHAIQGQSGKEDGIVVDLNGAKLWQRWPHQRRITDMRRP